MTRAFGRMNTVRGEKRRGATIRARPILGRRENEAILNYLVTWAYLAARCPTKPRNRPASDEQLFADIVI